MAKKKKSTAKKVAKKKKSAKKKASVGKSTKRLPKKSAKKKVTKKSASRKKAARKSAKKSAKKQKGAKKKAAGRKVAKSKATKKQPGAKKKKAVRPMPLGRPKVTLDSKLDELFLKDYEVRQVFEFLNVRTLRELEEHKPDEIVTKLTEPMVQAVGRIRKVLALQKRCLKGDEKFAREFKQMMQQQRFQWKG